MILNGRLWKDILTDKKDCKKDNSNGEQDREYVEYQAMDEVFLSWLL